MALHVICLHVLRVLTLDVLHMYVNLTSLINILCFSTERTRLYVSKPSK